MTRHSTVTETARRVRTQEESAQTIIQRTLTRIDKWNDSLGAFLSISHTAMEEARAIDSRIQSGQPVGPLCGVPIAVKDLVDTKDLPTTYGGLHRFPDRGRADAAVVTRLREAGAIIIGKTNLHEYAFGTTNVNPHYGPARNPWDRERISGGSSGGSSVAVVAGLCAGAIGTDTGGSIRIPAALTGHVGFKPTYGLISKSGVFPLAPSVDHVGPMTHSVADAALMLDVMAERMPSGTGSFQVPIPPTANGDLGRPLRIGIAENYFFDLGEPDVLRVVDDALSLIVKCGLEKNEWTVQKIEIPMMDVVPTAQSILLFSEALAVHEDTLSREASTYGADVLKRLTDAKAYKPHEYQWAKSVQTQFQRAIGQTFGEVDVILTPSVPVAAPRINQGSLTLGNQITPVPSILNRCTNPWNLSHLPALSMPCGLSADGLPIAIQLIAAWFSESMLLGFAQRLEDILPELPRLTEYE